MLQVTGGDGRVAPEPARGDLKVGGNNRAFYHWNSWHRWGRNRQQFVIFIITIIIIIINLQRCLGRDHDHVGFSVGVGENLHHAMCTILQTKYCTETVSPGSIGNRIDINAYYSLR